MPASLSSIARYICLAVVAGGFVTMGVLHFVAPEPFVRIVPPYLPAPLALVYVSGLFEIAGGLGILVPRTRRAAGYGLIALLVAVFPANLHMALNPDQFGDVSATALYVRLPFQVVFAALVWVAARGWAHRPDGARQTASPARAVVDPAA